MRALSEGLAAKLRRDNETARACWEPLAEAGDPRAQYYLVNLYDDDFNNHLEAALMAERLTMSAAGNDPQAQYYLGLLFQYGRGVARDHNRALEWLTRAADAGDMQARYRLGHMYRHGFGVVRNDTIAEEWLRRSDIAFVDVVNVEEIDFLPP